MATSDAQKRASAKYNKEKMRQLAIRFSPNEMELFDHVKAQPNIAGYIKRLVREDMEAGRSLAEAPDGEPFHRVFDKPGHRTILPYHDKIDDLLYAEIENQMGVEIGKVAPESPMTYEFEVLEHDGMFVALPFDFAGGTQGTDFDEACEMASDWLLTEAECRIDGGEGLPQPTVGNEARHGGEVVPVKLIVVPACVLDRKGRQDGGQGE